MNYDLEVLLYGLLYSMDHCTAVPTVISSPNSQSEHKYNDSIDSYTLPLIQKELLGIPERSSNYKIFSVLR